MNRYVSWGYNMTDEDVEEIRIHRSLSSNFTPSSSTLIATVTSDVTTYMDDVVNDVTYYYIIEAVVPSGIVTTSVLRSEPTIQPSVSTPSIQNVSIDTSIVTLSSSSFSGTNSTHINTDWVIVRDDNGGTDYSYGDSENLESVDLELLSTGTYSARVRHNADVAYSEWSNWYGFDYTYIGVPATELGHVTTMKINDNDEIVMFSRSTGKVFNITSEGNVLNEFRPQPFISQCTVNSLALLNDSIYLARWGTQSGFSVTTLDKFSYSGERDLQYYGGSGSSSGDDPRAVAVDQSGFLYVGFERGYLGKYSPNGNEVWRNEFGSVRQLEAIALDSVGNILCARNDGTIFKVDTNGNEITNGGWPISPHPNTIINSLSIDGDDNIYTSSLDNTVKKIDSSGNILWSVDHPNTVRFATIATDGSIYSSCSDGRVRKIDQNGGIVWAYSGHMPSLPEAIAVDSTGIIYSGSSGAIHKLDPVDGTILLQIPQP